MELDLRIVRWLLAKALALPSGLDEVATLGSGPLEEQQFDSLLQDLGIQVYAPNEDTEILIIGREDWSERDLHQLLEARSGQHLRVYSQEMFLAYLISGIDPLVGAEKDVRRLAGDHPALNFLEAVGFRWPTTQVPGRGSGTIDADMPPLGLLGFKGYKVGRAGLATRDRHQILAGTYKCELPRGLPFYASEWGTPGSSKRLRKMATSIAAFCRLRKKMVKPQRRAMIEGFSHATAGSVGGWALAPSPVRLRRTPLSLCTDRRHGLQVYGDMGNTQQVRST